MPMPEAAPSFLPVHIAAGTIAILAGYLALYAAKGNALHRRSGLTFVAAMMVMSLTGALAAFGSSTVSVIAGLLTFYFVTTALLTVRPVTPGRRTLDLGLMAFALVIAIAALGVAVSLVNSGRLETAPMFVFAAVGFAAVSGDVRMLRAGSIQGSRRLARHLWRMCFAMWVAAASFFWGPPRRVPEVLRVPPLLAVLVLTPVAVMLYWLWRLRTRRAAATLARASGTA